MTKDVWLNLPVKNVNKSREFFTQIGFTLNKQYGNGGQSASFQVGEKNFIVMLYAEDTFRNYTKNEISDAKVCSEVLISFNAESRDEIDETASKVFEAGGRIFAEPSEMQGWMYGFGFADLDGHRWNMVYMDFSKLPKV